MVDIILHGKVPSKKNSKKIIPYKGRHIIVSDDKHRSWNREQSKVVNAWKSVQSCPLPLSIASVVITMYPPDRRAGDLTNKAESIMDLLVDCGVLVDDNWFVCGDVHLKLGSVDRDNPRAEVSLIP